MITILTILASVSSIVGLSGALLLGVGAVGAGGGILGWLAVRKVPWKIIAVAAAAMAIALWAFAGYSSYKSTQNSLIQAKIDLGQMKILRDAEKQRADNYIVEHNSQLARIKALEVERVVVDDEATLLRQQINDLNLEKEFTRDQAKALANLNARNAQLNRLLSQASGARRKPDASKAAGGAKASKTDATSALQRALQSLR